VTADFGGFRKIKHLLIIFSLYRFEFHTKTLIFIVFEMSNFVLTKQHLREVLIFCFNWKKSAAETHRMLVEVYGNTAPTDKSCREWFRRFKDGDFSVEDKLWTAKKIRRQRIRGITRRRSESNARGVCRIALGVTQQAVSVRLRVMGMIQKQGNWYLMN